MSAAGRAASGDKAVRDRLLRVQGQVGGIVRMLEDGRDCEAVVTQVMAVRAALERVAAELVSSRVDDCVATLPRARARTAVRDAVALLGRLS